MPAECGEGFWQPRWYIWPDTGLAFVSDTDVTVEERPTAFNPDGTPAYGPGSANWFKAEFDSGYWVGLGGGMEINPWFAIELETSYGYNKISSFTWSGSLGNTQVISQLASGSLYRLLILPCVILKYPIALSNGCKLVPLVGAGGGVAVAGLSLRGLEVTSDGWDVRFDTEDSSGATTYQVSVGVRYEFTERASVGVQYRYSGVGSITLTPEQSEFLGNDRVKLDGFSTHKMSVGLLWFFN